MGISKQHHCMNIEDSVVEEVIVELWATGCRQIGSPRDVLADLKFETMEVVFPNPSQPNPEIHDMGKGNQSSNQFTNPEMNQTLTGPLPNQRSRLPNPTPPGSMSFLYWKCHGLGNKQIVPDLQDILFSNKPSCVFVKALACRAVLQWLFQHDTSLIIEMESLLDPQSLTEQSQHHGFSLLLAIVSIFSIYSLICVFSLFSDQQIVQSMSLLMLSILVLIRWCGLQILSSVFSMFTAYLS